MGASSSGSPGVGVDGGPEGYGSSSSGAGSIDASGVVVYGSGDAGLVDAGIMVIVDGAAGVADSPADGYGIITGSVYNPPDGGDDATGPCGGGVCGVIVHPDGG
jgi:hypothetical protein